VVGLAEAGDEFGKPQAGVALADMVQSERAVLAAAPQEGGLLGGVHFFCAILGILFPCPIYGRPRLVYRLVDPSSLALGALGHCCFSPASQLSLGSGPSPGYRRARCGNPDTPSSRRPRT